MAEITILAALGALVNEFWCSLSQIDFGALYVAGNDKKRGLKMASNIKQERDQSIDPEMHRREIAARMIRLSPKIKSPKSGEEYALLPLSALLLAVRKFKLEMIERGKYYGTFKRRHVSIKKG